MKRFICMLMLLACCGFLFGCAKEQETTGTDYGTLTIADVQNLSVKSGERSKLRPQFSDPAYKEEVTYSFEGDAISIENGYVQALLPGTTVVVTAKTSHHEITFTVTTAAYYGQLSVSDLTVWAGEKAAPLQILFELPDQAEALTYSYDDSMISIDEAGRVTGLKKGCTQVTVSSEHFSAVCKVTVMSKESIKILAIGNSFSVDAMEHLWGIFKAAGFGEVKLGNLYIGGCSLDMHWENIQNNRDDYTYYTNDSGVWQQKPSETLMNALISEDWDVITVQQASPVSGIDGSYGALQSILDAIEENKTNPGANICWNMTWAYQANSNHTGFASYDRDQLQMYEAIVTATQNQVLPKSEIADVLPCGTALQNLRTSYIGDVLTRDGYHLSYDLGRYTAALTWFAQITRMPVTDVDFVPESYENAIRPHLDAIRKAVAAAIENPYQVTKIN